MDDNNRLVSKYDVPYGAHVLVKENEMVERTRFLYEWDPYNSVIVAEHNGIINYST
jgi:DNA-directed RNA polymerase subunit beta'